MTLNFKPLDTSKTRSLGIFSKQPIVQSTLSETPETPETSKISNFNWSSAIPVIGNAIGTMIDGLNTNNDDSILNEVYEGGGLFGLGQKQSIDSINNAFNSKIARAANTLSGGFSSTNEALDAFKNLEFRDNVNIDSGLVGKGIGSILVGAPFLETRKGRGWLNTSALSSATKGAAMGTSILPGWGTAGGAILGDLASKFSVFGTPKREKTYNRGVQKLNAFNMTAFNNALNNYEKQQIGSMLENYAAEGGQLQTNGAVWNTGLNVIGNGGSHEENSFDGVQLGTDNQGIPNLVEEGETVWNNYVFSKRLSVPDDVKKKLGIKSNTDVTFADASIKFTDDEHVNDPVTRDYLEESLSKLREAQETLRMKQQIEDMKHSNKRQFDKGGSMETLDNNDSNEDDIKAGKFMEKVPFGSLGAFANAIGKSLKGIDYSNVNDIENSINMLRNVSATPVSEYSHLTQYKPMDVNYYLNRADADSAARRRMFNTFNPSSGAMQLASDLQANARTGEIMRTAEEQNLRQRLGLFDAISKIRQFNAQQALQASQANAEMSARAAQMKAQAAQLRQSLKNARENDIDVSMSAGLQYFTDWYKDKKMLEAIENNPALAQGIAAIYKR